MNGEYIVLLLLMLGMFNYQKHIFCHYTVFPFVCVSCDTYVRLFPFL